MQIAYPKGFFREHKNVIKEKKTLAWLVPLQFLGHQVEVASKTKERMTSGIFSHRSLLFVR